MQQSFADLEYAAKKRLTRRDRFLGELEILVPWAALCAEIEPFYPKAGQRGRQPIGLERMLRMYLAQQCFGMTDEGIEDALYDSQAIRGFVGVDLARESAPDATTLLKFRRLLNEHDLTARIFACINATLSDKGLMLREGTIVDATIIEAPSSTKNQKGERDPQMHQTKKGNQWHFGMKAHIGVDAHSGLIHTVVSTAGNDVTHRPMHCFTVKSNTDMEMPGIRAWISAKKWRTPKSDGSSPCVRANARTCQIRPGQFAHCQALAI
jgi:IS5 family transposase